jgi:hypothetical protein
MKKLISRLAPLFATLTLLSACILVTDFGRAWNEAMPDSCLGKIAESLYYAEFNRAPDEEATDHLARGWTHQGQHYLLLKKNVDDKGGRLYRFHVANGIFERFRLVPTMRDAFEITYPNAPVSLRRDTVTLDALDDSTLPLLAEIGTRAEYWESADKTLYNPMLNPACRFEDRDLKKIANDAGKKTKRKSDAKK